MRRNFDAIYWTMSSLIISFVAARLMGDDAVSSTLLLAVGSAGALASWQQTRHLALWLSSGVAAVSGALLSVVLEAAMNGAEEDPATTAIVFAFAGGAAISAALHNHIAQTQVRRERELDKRLAALPTADEVAETERRVATLFASVQVAQAPSWRLWWRSRPGNRALRSGFTTKFGP